MIQKLTKINNFPFPNNEYAKKVVRRENSTYNSIKVPMNPGYGLAKLIL